MAPAARRNLITDVPGLRVGHAHDALLRSGVTVLLAEAPAAAACDIRGGGPGTRETRLLEPEGLVQEIHALVLSGGSAFGLDAATGAQAYLRERGIGFPVGDTRVPIVPQAILFDLLNGGDKGWGRRPPYQELAFAACESAATAFALGTVGAGYGATTERLKGGLGSASSVTGEGFTVGALVACNAAGNVTMGASGHFWAAPFERDGEFGGRGWPDAVSAEMLAHRLKGLPGESTTLAVVATDATLDRAGLRRLAIMAQTGLARAIHPVHTPLDGDVVFALATARRPAPDPAHGLAALGAEAADTLARAVARSVYEATGFEGVPAAPPAYRELFR